MKNSAYGTRYRGKAYDYQYRPQHSFSDIGNANYAAYQIFLTNLSKQRRCSVPQDIFIRSLNNYTA